MINTIDALKETILYEQALKEKTGLNADIKLKIDLESSIALSAKLIYQLTQVSI